MLEAQHRVWRCLPFVNMCSTGSGLHLQVRSSARYMLGAAERQTSGIDILHETSGLQEVASETESAAEPQRKQPTVF